jgi:SpoVK/Ycf46/Vps4 family AAA+-type ATPase
MCKDFSGADLKSIVCDALVKAFHRSHDNLAKEKGLDLKIGSSQQNEISQDMIQSCIKISMQDLTTSVETIKKTINMNERMRMKTL